MENKISTKQWIKQVIWPYRYKVVFLCLLAALISLLNLINAALLKSIIDAAVYKNKTQIIHYAIILAFITAFGIIVNLYYKYSKEKNIYRIEHYIQHRVFTNLLYSDFEEVTNKHSEDWLNRIRLDSTKVATESVSLLPAFIDITISIVGTTYLILKTAPSFLPLVLIGVLIVLFINIVLKEPFKQKQRELQETYGEKNTYLSEALSHLMIVKAFCREKIISLGAQKQFDNLFKKKVNKLRITTFKNSTHTIAAKIAIIVVVIYCAFNIFNNKLTYGTCIMLLRLLSQLSAPLTEMSYRLSSIFDTTVGVERLQEAESLPLDSNLPPKSDDEIRDYYDASFKEIVLKDATFSYSNKNDKPSSLSPTVLSNVNLTIPKHSTIAITGLTGSGKSTLFKILLSLYPLESGSKILKNIDGSEVELSTSYRSLFAYVPQGNQLMSGTVRDMITFGSVVDNSKDEEIMKAAETACASEFINILPNGLDTDIKEGGIGLSEGQLQRIAIARAIFTKRPVLLLDEATSALDEKTELELLSHIKNLTDCTSLFVTHRLAALSICEYEIHIDGENISVKSLKNNMEKSS